MNASVSGLSPGCVGLGGFRGFVSASKGEQGFVRLWSEIHVAFVRVYAPAIEHEPLLMSSGPTPAPTSSKVPYSKSYLNQGFCYNFMASSLTKRILEDLGSHLCPRHLSNPKSGKLWLPGSLLEALGRVAVPAPAYLSWGILYGIYSRVYMMILWVVCFVAYGI